MRATIQEVTAVGDSVPVVMAVTANPAADHSGGRVDRWQVVTLTDAVLSATSAGSRTAHLRSPTRVTVRADAATTDPAGLSYSTLSGALSFEIVSPQRT